jgi:hypothetical protein
MAAVKPLALENVRIGFRNFEGREGKYNKAGERSFAVFLSDRQLAEELAAEGWNVKFPTDREDKVDPDEPGRDPYLQVSVGFEYYPPNVFIISNGQPTKLTEEEVLMLDWAEIQNVDLVLRPYEWSVNRNSGIKAYLKSGYFTIVTDKFASKYGL